jgi:hypothetical protein
MDEAYEFQKKVLRGEIELPMIQGGPGSGNHGHSGGKGGPGNPGGSSPKGGGGGGASEAAGGSGEFKKTKSPYEKLYTDRASEAHDPDARKALLSENSSVPYLKKSKTQIPGYKGYIVDTENEKVFLNAIKPGDKVGKSRVLTKFHPISAEWDYVHDSVAKKYGGDIGEINKNLNKIDWKKKGYISEWEVAEYDVYLKVE